MLKGFKLSDAASEATIAGSDEIVGLAPKNVRWRWNTAIAFIKDKLTNGPTAITPEDIDAVEVGSGVSQLVNDAGYVVGPLPPPIPGDSGWSPVPALVVDGERCVIQVVNWVGGEGDKPESGMYVGADGFVNTPQEAVDVRGEIGPQGPEGPTPTTFEWANITGKPERTTQTITTSSSSVIVEKPDLSTTHYCDLTFTGGSVIRVIAFYANQWNNSDSVHLLVNPPATAGITIIINDLNSQEIDRIVTDDSGDSCSFNLVYQSTQLRLDTVLYPAF